MTPTRGSKYFGFKWLLFARAIRDSFSVFSNKRNVLVVVFLMKGPSAVEKNGARAANASSINRVVIPIFSSDKGYDKEPVVGWARRQGVRVTATKWRRLLECTR